jgi:hypothetical protein
MLDSKRTVAELKELRALTGDENGAQRVAFTETWARAREWLREKADAIAGVETHRDEAGNFWATLPGESEKALLIGGHIDSVPNGGWLDGCLNTLAGIEILRRISTQYDGKPPVTVRVVDWADEEGARFGKKPFRLLGVLRQSRHERSARAGRQRARHVAPSAEGMRDRLRGREGLRQRAAQRGPRIWNYTSSRGRCSSVSICR